MSDIIFSVFPNENFVDLGLYQFGKEQCRTRTLFRSRLPQPLSVPLCNLRNRHPYGGRSERRHSHISDPQRPGLHDFSETDQYLCSRRGTPLEYVWLEFDGLRAKEIIEIAGLSPENPVYHAHSKDLREKMMQEMLYIAEHSDESPFHLIGHLYLFIDYLSRSAASMKLSNSGKLKDFYIKEALNYIEQNFQNDISVEGIAAFCGLNRSYFGRIFKDTIGKSPQKFLMNYRMVKAAELLKLTHLPISDIGNAVGYPNQLHFSRAFKHIYGISPREWRNKNRMDINHRPVRNFSERITACSPGFSLIYDETLSPVRRLKPLQSHITASDSP